jgi:hypothetical protein
MVESDLKLAFDTLTAKKPIYDKYFDYYDGRAKLVYSQERLREIFADLNARFTQNWCAVVVDSVLERIQLRGFTVAKSPDQETALTALVELNELTLEADSVHLAAEVCGEAFVFAWKEDGDEFPQAYYNDPRMCHAFYSGDNPRELRMVCKWWRSDDKFVRLNLYYPDRIEYYITGKEVDQTIDIGEVSTFQPAQETAINPYERIPVFHYRRERRAIRSELNNAIEPQDAINKLCSDMMVSAEFAAFKQRYIISQANVAKLKNQPGIVWDIPAGDGEGQQTQVGELSATELSNYLEPIKDWRDAIAIITRTPKHYFFSQGGEPSGEALIALEAPLNKKCQKHIDRYAVTWRALAHFMLQLQGVEVNEIDIAAVFDKPETVQPRTEAEIREINTRAGIPLRTQLRDDGWTDAEIETMEDDKRQEAKIAQENMPEPVVSVNGNGAVNPQKEASNGVDNRQAN